MTAPKEVPVPCAACAQYLFEIENCQLESVADMCLHAA